LHDSVQYFVNEKHVCIDLSVFNIYINLHSPLQNSSIQKIRSSAIPEIAHNAYDVEVAIQGHARSSIVVPIDAAYMTSY